MDVSSNSSFSTQTVKKHIQGKINGSLKSVIFQTSLAAKIKTKNLNNSSYLKVLLKNNNKALACALTAERQNSRRLENDKMFLQKEVKMLHYQNALLRQNLSIAHTMLKDIDLFLNINLPAAIEITSTMEPLDLLSSDKKKSKRFSRQSTMSLEEDHEFRLTGMALRVPSSTVEQQKHTRVPEVVLSEDYPLQVSPSTSSHIVLEKSDQQANNSLTLPSKESLSTYNESTSRNSLCNSRACDPPFHLDETLTSSRGTHSDRYVTTRRKRSAISRSSAQSVNSDVGTSRESCPITQREINASSTLPDICDETSLHFDFVRRTNRPSKLSCSFSQFEKLDTDQNLHTKRESSDFPAIEDEAVTANQTFVQNASIEEEKTIYEADMEITSSDSAAIHAIVSNKTTLKSKFKSNVSVKQDRTSLRKVKLPVREKSNKKNFLCDQKIISSSENKHASQATIGSNEITAPEAKLSAQLNLSPHTSEQYDYRRTYVLPGPVKLRKNDDLESATHSNSVNEMVGEPTKQTASVNNNSPNNTALQSGHSEFTFPIKQKHNSETSQGSGEATSEEKGEQKSRKRVSKSINHFGKKKRKINSHSIDEKHLGEDKDKNTSVSSEQVDNRMGTNLLDNYNIKNQGHQIRRETYVISAEKPLPVTSGFLSKNQINYRRDTFVIPKPIHSASIANKTLELEEDSPLNEKIPVVPRDVFSKTDIGLDCNKADSKTGKINPVLDEDSDKWNYKCPESKGTSTIFSRLDKYSCSMPAKQCDLDKDFLVRESSGNVPSIYNNKPARILNTILSNKRDSLMLDMVSESILEETLESPSFVEFPSSTDPEGTFCVSLNTTTPVELPVSEDCNNRELSYAAKCLGVLDEKDFGKSHDQLHTTVPQSKAENTTVPQCKAENTTVPQCKAENETVPQCKAENETIMIQEPDNKPLQDLTNKVLEAVKQSPSKSSSNEDDSKGYTRRRRNAVNYKEPSLGRKLRR